MKYKKPCLIYLIAFVSLFQSTLLHAQTTADSMQVVQRMLSFTDAFSNLRWEEFISFFADDATAFFPPSAAYANRANNKAAIENIFKNVFANARKTKTSPPYLIITAVEQKIQLAGNIAIVSFLLQDPAMLGRRTIVFEKRDSAWFIVHLHASGIALIN